ncbi:AidB family quorum-quenching N-acyl homoserine lactonase [Lichenibacterium dinghuense]|uniref:AidB family quorum-quenching N-acyl homoserine lactonase n=1 Tax=Lichenibacterium dinghuense TaxID=2895977 RepID=UPI001F3E8D47|nr:MBL fold metallo-hydrolase [Lichenibacterium sp. 6Y81]
MAKRHLHIGGTAVDLLLDGPLGVPREHLIHDRGPAALAAAVAGLDERSLSLDVNCFLLRGPRGIELVDAGAGGPSRGADLGHARAALAERGVAPDAIVRIYLTHMHFDHMLGLIDGDEAFFPRAELVVPAADLAFYTDPAERERVPEAWRETFDEAGRVAAAYAGRLRAAPFGPVMPGVELLPIPGHSRGQGAYLFTDAGGTLLLFGDLLHLAVEQATDPDLGLVYDDSPTDAADARRAVLACAAAEGWTVGGGHLRGFGRVALDGAGFRIDPLA